MRNERLGSAAGLHLRRRRLLLSVSLRRRRLLLQVFIFGGGGFCCRSPSSVAAASAACLHLRRRRFVLPVFILGGCGFVVLDYPCGRPSRLRFRRPQFWLLRRPWRPRLRLPPFLPSPRPTLPSPCCFPCSSRSAGPSPATCHPVEVPAHLIPSCFTSTPCTQPSSP